MDTGRSGTNTVLLQQDSGNLYEAYVLFSQGNDDSGYWNKFALKRFSAL